MKQVYLTITLLIVCLTTFAQAPSGYYNSATGTGYTLKTQLKNIIDNNNDGLSPEYQSTDPGYSGLYETYKTSDVDNYYENNGTVLDMYTENPSGTDVKEYDHDTDRDPGSGGTSEGQYFNREHIIPQSFFSQSTPERSDAHFVVPSDKYVNNQRGSFPFGVVQTPNATYTNGSRRGNNLNSGYSAGYTNTVFEPIDEFKGDIARMHFYFATRYEDDIPTYSANYDMIIKSSQQVYTDTFLSILLQWHAQDPVSQREIDRNNAIFARQNNRNPFIDNPTWVNTIWGGGTADTQAPTTPTNLTASNPTATTVDLSWTASTDNTAVTNYDIYIGGSFYVSTNSAATTYTVTGLSPETMYAFTVLATDAANNMSAQSTTANETTLMGSGSGSECANESFQNIPSSGGIPTSYTTRIWTGDNGLIWNATDARTDQTINGEAITVRNGNLTSPTIGGGIGELTVTTQLTFGGTSGTFDLLVNGVSVGSIPYSGDNTTPTTTTVSNINIEGNVIVVLDNQSTSNRVRIDDLSWTCYSAPSTDLQLAAKVYLQGAAINRSFVSGEEDWMRDDLRVNNLIPTTSPYDATTCNATVFNTVGSDAIVDWVLVQLRDSADNTSVIESQSALLQRDGDIVDVDGTSSLSFTAMPDNYFIAIKHRNHLGIMSSNTITLSTIATTVDFTDSATPITFGTDAQTTYIMPTGVAAMWAGDANQDGKLNYLGGQSDVPSIRSQVFNDPNNSVFGGPPVATYLSAGYNATDINLDGNTVYSGATSDVLHIRNNIFNNPSNSVFGGPPVATYIFTQQLPEGAN